ncbi:MAG: DUF3501 family protein [Gammaproteobacteria bacterium]|nr:DUF3501 family protein [Gammaproteobacteria bacterium]
MTALVRSDLMSLEEYARRRTEFRARVMRHKQDRQVQIGNHARLYFEDRLTIQYQIQEMLRIEKIFEAEGIEAELSAYNPLIPDGRDWKATFMLEYEDGEERKLALARLQGIAGKVWAEVGGERVFAVADEDGDREDEEKTSSVHFLRFDLTDGMIKAARAGQPIRMGIDHRHYRHDTVVADSVRASLVADLR